MTSRRPAGITREKLVYQIARADYEKEWGKQYEKPGALEKTLAVFFRIVPKVGPFATLSFKPPTPAAESLFLKSFDETLNRYRGFLRRARTEKLNLENRDFDTGELTRAGEYKLADDAYAKLLNKLAGKGFETVPRELRQNILAFYGDLSAPPLATKQDKHAWCSTPCAPSRS